MDKDVITPQVEEENILPTDVDPVPATKEEELTISDVLGLEDTTEQSTKHETVSLKKYMDEKKDFKKTIADLRKQIEQNGNSEDISESIDELAEEYPEIDPSFIKKLSKTLKSELKKETEAELKPIKEKERKEHIDQAFKREFDKVLDQSPEYKDIANPDVIKALSLDPRNAKKTFSQIVEEAYGKAIVGRRTMETTTPRGGNEPETIDYDRANTDEKYLAEILANPDTKDQFNKRNQQYLRL